jgi:hypothetical protein
MKGYEFYRVALAQIRDATRSPIEGGTLVSSS